MAIPNVQEILEKDIFELMGVPDISDERKEEMLQTMVNTVDARVAARVADLLKEDEVEEFKQIADSGETEKLVNFLVEKKIDLPQIVSEEATRYRVEVVQLLGLTEEAAKSE